jgi:hypothetical protein
MTTCDMHCQSIRRASLAYQSTMSNVFQHCTTTQLSNHSSTPPLSCTTTQLYHHSSTPPLSWATTHPHHHSVVPPLSCTTTHLHHHSAEPLFSFMLIECGSSLQWTTVHCTCHKSYLLHWRRVHHSICILCHNVSTRWCRLHDQHANIVHHCFQHSSTPPLSWATTHPHHHSVVPPLSCTTTHQSVQWASPSSHWYLVVCACFVEQLSTVWLLSLVKSGELLTWRGVPGRMKGLRNLLKQLEGVQCHTRLLSPLLVPLEKELSLLLQWLLPQNHLPQEPFNYNSDSHCK